MPDFAPPDKNAGNEVTNKSYLLDHAEFMRVTPFFAVLFSAQQLTAQPLLFPKDNFKDSITLAQTIPALAEQLIAGHVNPDKTGYYDDVFRYLLVAGQYDRAI